MKLIKTTLTLLPLAAMAFVGITSCDALKDDVDDYKMNRLEYIDGTQTTPQSISGTTWVGEFSGYEANAKRIFYVRRRVEYKNDGTYQIDYWGSEDKNKLSADNKDKMDQFEIETGRYTYSNGVVSYTCQEDKIVDYETYNLYNNDGQYKASETRESIRTATTTKNKTAWIAKDNYLWADVEDNSKIEYDMVKQ